jgi:hypothetical protein
MIDPTLRRIRHAIDTNPVLCERCGIRWWDVRQPGMIFDPPPTPAEKAAEVWRLKDCKVSTELCEGSLGLIAVYHGKRFANAIRKTMLNGPPKKTPKLG